MRLLIISNAYPDTVLGGYEHAARDIAQVALHQGWEVEVLTSNWPASSAEEIGPAHRLLKWNLQGLRPPGLETPADEGVVEPNAGIVEVAIGRFRPDRILLMNLQGLGIVSILAPIMNSGIPTTAYLMDNWPRIRSFESGWNFDWILSPLLQHSGIQWIACSRTLATEVEIFSGGAVLAQTIVPAWVKCNDSPVPRTQRSQRLIYVSSISQEKGALETFEAFVELSDRFPDLTLDFFGDGPLRHELESRAATAREGAVSFHGWVPRIEVRRQLPNFGVLLFPTWSREPFGFVVLEAMAARVPVVSTLHGGTEGMPEDCFVPCVQSGHSIARAVSRLIQDRDFATKIAENARGLVRDRHEQDAVVGVLLEKIQTHTQSGAPRAFDFRQSSTFEILGKWLEAQQYDSSAHLHLGRVWKLYQRLPFSMRRVVRPIGVRLLGLAQKARETKLWSA